MKKIKSIVGVGLLMISLLFPQISVIAQPLSNLSPQKTENYSSKLNPQGLQSAQLGNCFDVYNLTDIELNIGVDQQNYQPADAIILRGSIQNNNPYPLPELTLKANIFKRELNGDTIILKTVDEFVVKNDIQLASLQSYPINTVYSLPISAAKGEYEVTFSLVQDNQISIAGLSFADEAPALNSASTVFSVGGENQEKVSINQSQITINDQIYNNLEPNPIYAEIKPVTIKVPIQNNTLDEQKVEVSYEVYNWSDDGGYSSADITQMQEITLKGQENTNLVYILEDIQKAVYYIKVTVKVQDTPESISWSNIANIRFTHENISEPRLVFSGFNTSPYNPEKDLKLVTCIHNINNGEVNGTLENSVRDEKGRIIAQSQYNGTISGQVDGIYTVLPKNRSYNTLTVTSTFKDSSGNVVDTIELVYDCQLLDPKQCTYRIQDTGVWILFITLFSLVGLVFIGLKLYTAKRIKL